MDRWNVSCKIPSMLEKSRKTATSNSTIIYTFYDILETQLKQFNFQDRLECLWNVDETNLYTDPQKTRVVAEQSSKASHVSTASGRKAITVMAGISAAGENRRSWLPLLFSKVDS